MAKDDIGRIAGHHITPGRGWRWQEFGGRMMLVTDGGGADVVLSMPGAKTCDPDGRLVSFLPNSPLGRALAELPLMANALRDFEKFNDRPRQLIEVRGILERAGL